MGQFWPTVASKRRKITDKAENANVKPPPPSLFKYCCAKRGLSILTENKIRFTPPEEFNDPFELLPLIAPNASELDMLTQKQLQVEYAFADVTPGSPLRPLDYKGFVKSTFKAQRDHAEKTAVNLPSDFAEQIRASMGKKFGVLSLSATKENLIMWAHYADEHRGCVLEFDTQHQFFGQAWLKSLRKVTYSGQRPRYVYESSDSAHLYHKSLDWKEEAEWRILGDFSTMERISPEAGKTIYLTKLPIGVVTAVYLGARMSENDSVMFQRIAPNNSVKLLKATTDRKEFALHFAPNP